MTTTQRPERLAPSELIRRGMQALCQEFGTTDATRFIQHFSNGSGNYTEDRVAILAGLSVDDIVSEMKSLQLPQSAPMS